MTFELADLIELRKREDGKLDAIEGERHERKENEVEIKGEHIKGQAEIKYQIYSWNIFGNPTLSTDQIPNRANAILIEDAINENGEYTARFYRIEISAKNGLRKANSSLKYVQSK